MVMRHMTAVTLAFAVGLLASCSAPPAVSPEGPVWRDNDDRPIPEPRFHEPSLAWTSFVRTGPEQLRELLDIDRNVRKLAGAPTESTNVNAYDETPNSSWFTNRQGYPATRLNAEEILLGPVITSGPDTSETWKVFRPKIGGATPGFWIEDSRGDQYLIKFDPATNPELTTGAAAIGSRYFHACGYNVPQETIVYWRPEMLIIKDGATIKSGHGGRRPLTLEDIAAEIESVHREPDGTIRSLASLNLGNVKGPFGYNGSRHDDPNDWAPHQHRRELRGLRVIASLINHHDLKDHNSMDVYVGESGAGHLKHYLIDFGSALGADGSYVKHPRKGYANAFDLRDVLVTTVTLGLKTWGWENATGYEYASIGYFESEIFDPGKFDPITPNPAFEQLTDRDGYWGAKVVMGFSRGDLEALVEAGQYSNPRATEYLLKTLLERQKKIGRYWFGKVNPIDYPRLEQSDSVLRIAFSDLWVESGLGVRAEHTLSVSLGGETIISGRKLNAEVITLDSDDIRRLLAASVKCGNEISCHVFRITIRSERDGRKWESPTVFSLYLDAKLESPKIVGIEHPS